MSNKPRKRSAVALAFGTTIALGAGLAGAAAPGTSQGPSTTTDPYVIPIDASKVQIKSLLTVADGTVGGYKMVGIPDGLGAYTNGDGSVTLLSNHELTNLQGIGRAHGSAGAFSSKWTITPGTGAFTAGTDLMTTVDYSLTTPNEFNRFCSADLAAAGSFSGAAGAGIAGQLFLNGEESGTDGRALATDPTSGAAKVLTDFGRAGWETLVAANTAGSNTTLVMGGNDASATTGVNPVYIGTKQSTGTVFERAGLIGGELRGVVVTGLTTRTEAGFRSQPGFGKNNPKPFTLTDPVNLTTNNTGALEQAWFQGSGAGQQAISFDRTEDGAWDPSNPNDYYFVTTGSVASTGTFGRGGLWKLSFTDRTNPTLGGTLTLLLDGSESAPLYMPDNITIDNAGHILIQEDPGNDGYVARVWAYDIATQQLAPIATFDPTIFDPTSVHTAVTTYSRTGTAVTITTSAAHGFAVGDAVAVVGVSTLVNGPSVTVTAVTPTTFTYTLGSGPIASTSAPANSYAGKIVSGKAITADEESSGIIPAPAAFGANTFLFDAQVHTTTGLGANASELVERGQYLAMTVDFAQVFPTVTPEVPEAPLSVLLPLSALGIGAGAFAFMRRRRNTMA